MISKKINQKGFTLIELLVTIALMLSILGIAIVSFITVSNNKKEESWDLVKQQVETAATEYFNANEYLFEGLANGANGYITVGRLVEENYMNRVVNPVNGEMIDYCAQVKVTKNGNKLTASYDGIVDTTCDFKSEVVVSELGAPKIELEKKCTEGKNGWCISIATITAKTSENVLIDKKLDGCLDGDKVTCDNGKHTVIYTVTNSSGKKAVKSTDVKVDKEKPNAELTVNGNPTKGKDANGKETGWYISKVSLNAKAKCTNVSGCVLKNETGKVLKNMKNGDPEYNKLVYSNINNIETTKKLEICSVAGLCSYPSKSVKVDTIKPTVSISISSQNTKFKTNIATMTLKSSDSGSGLDVVTSNMKQNNGTSSWSLGGKKNAWELKYNTTVSNSLNGTSVTPNIIARDKAGNVNNKNTSKYTVYKDCSNIKTSTSYDHSCGNYGFRNKTVAKTDTKTGNVCGSPTKTKEDCTVKSITLDLNTNDAKASTNPGMGGVGPNGTNGKPIFNRPKDKYPTGANTYNYSKSAKRGMGVTVGKLSNGNIAYAAASCMNVGDFSRRFKYVITWTDGSKTNIRYASHGSGVTQNYTIYKDRNNPITLKSTDTTTKALKQCKNQDPINVNNCVKNTSLPASRVNVTTHTMQLAVGNVKSNKLILYTKYFADCGY